MNTIRKTRQTDIDRLMEIYHSAQERMIAGGNPNQWGHAYPPRKIVEDDIRKGNSFVLEEGEDIHAVFVMMDSPEPSYQVIDGAWLNDAKYVTIHRVARDNTAHGIFSQIMEFCRKHADNIRIDTHHDNHIMQAAIEKAGFSRCGIIRLADGSPRIAYQWNTN